MGKRRKARELTLQILYGLEMTGNNTSDVFSNFWENNPVSQEIREFTEALVKGTLEKLSFIDELLKQHMDNWNIERLAAIDRNILRFATYELLFRSDIPPRVTINEAIEIAKKYSTPDSGKFVNGILDKIKDEKTNP